MNLTRLQTFVAVYRTGSMTAAGGLLGLSQPTVTTQVRALERDLGQQLFRRLGRGVAPTAVAHELAAEAGPHVDALAALAERSSGQGDPFARPVHLGGPAELTGTRVISALSSLVVEGLRLRVTLGLPGDLVAGVTEGRVDLAVATVRPRARGVLAEPLADEELVLVGAPVWAERHPREGLRATGAAALAGTPLLGYAEDLPLVRRYWRSLFDTRPQEAAAVVVPDLRALLTAATAGAGVTVLPRYLCARALAAGTLVDLLEPEVPPINTLFLVRRPGAETQPAVAAVRSRLLMAGRTW